MYSKFISVEEKFRNSTEDPIIHDTPDYTYHSATISLPKPVQIVPAAGPIRSSSTHVPILPHKHVHFGENQLYMISSNSTVESSSLHPVEPVVTSSSASTHPAKVISTVPTSHPTTTTSTAYSTLPVVSASSSTNKLLANEIAKPAEYKLADQVVYDDVKRPYMMSTYYYLQKKKDYNYFTVNQPNAVSQSGSSLPAKAAISSSNPNLIVNTTPEVNVQPQVTITRSPTSILPTSAYSAAKVEETLRPIMRHYRRPEASSQHEIHKILKSEDAYSLQQTIGKYDGGSALSKVLVSGSAMSPTREQIPVQTTISSTSTTVPVQVEAEKKSFYARETPASIVLNHERDASYQSGYRYPVVSSIRPIQNRTLPLPLKRFDLVESSRPASLMVSTEERSAATRTPSTLDRIVSIKASEVSIPSKETDFSKLPSSSSTNPPVVTRVTKTDSPQGSNLEINIEIEPQSNVQATSIIINGPETPKTLAELKSRTSQVADDKIVTASKVENVVLTRIPYVTELSAPNSPSEDKDKVDIIRAFERPKEEDQETSDEEEEEKKSTKEAGTDAVKEDDATSQESTTSNKKSGKAKFKSALKKLNIFKKKK